MLRRCWWYKKHRGRLTFTSIRIWVTLCFDGCILLCGITVQLNTVNLLFYWQFHGVYPCSRLEVNADNTQIIDALLRMPQKTSQRQSSRFFFGFFFFCYYLCLTLYFPTLLAKFLFFLIFLCHLNIVQIIWWFALLVLNSSVESLIWFNSSYTDVSIDTFP